MYVLLLFFIIGTNVYALSPQDELIYEGIDISAWQGYVDFKKVKDAGIDVVYIKASEGTTYRNSYLESYYKGARENSLKIGFYHYLTATSVEEARRQADFFVSVIKGKEYECKLAMDYEEFFGVGKNLINEIAVAFMKRLKQITGKDVIVYSNLNNLKNTFRNEVADEGKLWIAFYSNRDYLNNVNSSWDTYIGIQYTSSGRVPGISGNVDRDKFSKEVLIKNETNPDTSGSGDKKTINYVVKKGDTLSEIALRYGTTVSTIARMNNIKNVNLIYPGQILKIEVNSKEETNADNQIIYYVKRGDTLWGISRKYGVTIQNLVDWNNIKNPNLIYVGERIKIYPNNPYNNNYENTTKYIVKKGDTLWGISRRYGITVSKLAKDNGIKNPNLIYPGQILKIF